MSAREAVAVYLVSVHAADGEQTAVAMVLDEHDAMVVRTVVATLAASAKVNGPALSIRVLPHPAGTKVKR